MKVILDEVEKQKYRSIENAMFNMEENIMEKVILKKFSFTEHFLFEEIRNESMFAKLKSKFHDTASEFCITTMPLSDPIFRLDLTKDTNKEYLGVMTSFNTIGITGLPNSEVGLSIIYERIFMYDINQKWCLYADRYNDSVILAF